MNPLGVHALVWTGRFDAAGARHAITSTKQAGFDLIEISLHQPELLDLDETRALLRDHDLGVTCSRGLGFDADPSSPDPEIARRGEQVLFETLRLTHELGGRYLCGALYSALGKYGAPATSAGRDNAVAALSRLAREAADLGITLGLEIVNRYESNLLNTAADCLRLIEDVDAPNVVVHLDTYHMNIEETDFVRPVVASGARLGYVHIGESNRGYLGSGTVDFQSFFHALADIDYTGPITFESFSSRVVTPGLSTDLAIWRNTWSDGADLARHARSFIVDQLRGAAR